jgi:uncharacterized protein (DUF433 family)
MSQLTKTNRPEIPWNIKKYIPTKEEYSFPKDFQTIQTWFKNYTVPKAASISRDEWIVVRLHYAAMILRDSVEIDPEIRGGVPVLKGTRITVSQILAEVAEDSKLSEIADDFNLDFNNLVKLFEGMSIHLDRPFHR